MLHPSYSDLMAVANSEVEDGEQPVVQSRYSIVMATSKRARQIIAGDAPLVEKAEGKKPLSIAVEELSNSKIKILGLFKSACAIPSRCFIPPEKVLIFTFFCSDNPTFSNSSKERL